MSSLDALNWDDRFRRLLPGDAIESSTSRQVRGAMWSPVSPTPVGEPSLIAWSPDVARMLGLSDEAVSTEGFTSAMVGNTVLEGMKPYAACYGGHQFGHWAGQLGDGRAINLGEVIHDGRRFDVQLKGAGPTPYSRYADGRAVLRSSIREFLCSEAMHHLGVPTTRALSLCLTGDDVMRDAFYDGHPLPEPGAIVCRVAPSFLRFGSFELPAVRRDETLLRALVAFAVGVEAPGATDIIAWASEIARRTAVLVTHWMRVGFVHGVLNTDNMSILGLTMDYGPYGWLEPYEPDWTPNTTDAERRRYCFGQQPRVAMWNLTRFVESLHAVVPDVPALESVVQVYADTLSASMEEMVASKLGLVAFSEADRTLWSRLLQQFEQHETDMTLFFRHLARVDVGPRAEERFATIEPAFYGRPGPELRAAWNRWLDDWSGRVRNDDRAPDAHVEPMNAANPLYVLRNYLAQEAIERAEDGDFTRIHELQDVLRRPYTEQSGREHFAAKRPEWARHKPGCSTLSCSS